METYDIDKLSKSVTMKVTVHLTKKLLIRTWIATQLIILAARILGCSIEFIDNDQLQPLPS